MFSYIDFDVVEVLNRILAIYANLGYWKFAKKFQ